MKKSITFSLLFLVTIALYGQSDAVGPTHKSKFISVGVKAGVPNLAGFSGELHLPVLKRFSVYVDYSKFNFDSTDFNIEEQGTLDLGYSEYGINYYLGKTSGRGFYLSAGLGNFNAKGAFTNIVLADDSTGEGSASISFNTTNFKLGLKTGGLIYFRMEAGYGMGNLPQEIRINASSGTYNETQIETIDYTDLPISNKGIPLVNLGIGLSF